MPYITHLADYPDFLDKQNLVLLSHQVYVNVLNYYPENSSQRLKGENRKKRTVIELDFAIQEGNIWCS